MDQKMILKVGGSLVAIVFSILWSMRSCAPPMSAEKNHSYVGTRLAEEVCSRFGSETGRYVILSLQNSNDVLDSEIEAFLTGMRACPSLTLDRIERIGHPGGDAQEFETGVPHSVLLSVVQGLSEADFIVSFVGFPLSPQRTSDKNAVAKLKKVIVANGHLHHVREWVNMGHIDLAVVYRADDANDLRFEALSPDQWFEKHYEFTPTQP